MSAAAVEVAPGERRRVEKWLAERRLAWGPGRTFAAGAPDALAAVARLVEPSPGDGYHREHVRILELAGEGSALAAVASVAGAAWKGRVEATTIGGATNADVAARIRASMGARPDDVAAALGRAGLVRELVVPGGWRERSVACDFEGWGRAEPGSLPVGGSPAARGELARVGEDVAIQWADAATRDALRRFLVSLVPGRAYPAGTLLSEAERLETERPRALDAPWIIARCVSGVVVGGLVFERVAGLGRAHVRRVHLDVGAGWRGSGIATRLLGAAREGARERLGALLLESDPRAGNAGACRALERAGFALAGTQLGAWRMRRTKERWDEDVRLYFAAT